MLWNEQYHYQWDTEDGIAVATYGYGLYVAIWISRDGKAWVHSQLVGATPYNRSHAGMYEEENVVGHIGCVGPAALMQDF